MNESSDMKEDAYRICDKSNVCTYRQVEILDDEITVHARMEYLPFSFK